MKKRYTTQHVNLVNCPDGWIICNAPRPLLGDILWYGPFVKGILYAGIDPSGPFAETWLQENTWLDACEVVAVTEAQCREAALSYLSQRYTQAQLDAALTPALESWLVERGLDVLNGRPEDCELWGGISGAARQGNRAAPKRTKGASPYYHGNASPSRAIPKTRRNRC